MMSFFNKKFIGKGGLKNNNFPICDNHF